MSDKPGFLQTLDNIRTSELFWGFDYDGSVRGAPTPACEGEPQERVCGDCRKPIRPACTCAEDLRICEEQQRADRAEEAMNQEPSATGTEGEG